MFSFKSSITFKGAYLFSQLASENGYTKIVKLLLADERVNSGANNNYAIRNASMNWTY